MTDVQFETDEFVKFKEIAKSVGLNVIEENKNVAYIGIGENTTDIDKGFYWNVSSGSFLNDLKDFDTEKQRDWTKYDKECGCFSDAGGEKRFAIKMKWIDKMEELKQTLKLSKKNAMENDKFSLSNMSKDELVKFMADRYYPVEEDREFFANNKVALDNDGKPQKIQAIRGDGNWYNIKDFGSIEELDNIFKRQKKNKEISSSIKLSEPRNLDEATKKWAEENRLFNKIWSGNDTEDMMRLLKDLDKKTWNEALEKNEFSKATIKIEIQSSKGDNVDIEAPLGKGIFQSGDLKKAIDFSSKNLDRNQISPELQEQFRKATATNEKGEYIDRVNHHNIERMFDGGFEKLAKSAESIGDEHLSAFVQGFANAYGFGRVQDTSEKVKVNTNPEKSPTKEQSSSKIRQDIENIKKDTIEAAKKVLDKSKGKNEKTISKATDKSM